MTRYAIIAVFVLLMGICVYAYAEENEAKGPSEKTQSSAASNAKKPKGVDLVTDAAAVLVTKANALLSGNLEITMSQDMNRYKNKNNYTLNAIGQKVPKLTSTKSGRR